MKAWINLLKGFRTTGTLAPLLVFLYVINLIFAITLTVPMYHSFQASFGNSHVGDRMAQGFDYLWWEEFRDQSEGLETSFSPSLIGKGAILHNLDSLVQMRFDTFPPLLRFWLLIYLVTQTFLAGGIVHILASGDPRFSIRMFFEGAGRYFIRYLAILIISWSFLFLVIGSLNRWFFTLVDKTARTAFSEITPFYLSLGLHVLILSSLLAVHMIFIYARISIASQNLRNPLIAIGNALRFVLRHPGSAFGLYGLLVAIQVLITFGFIFLLELIPQTETIGVAAAFLLQQVFIFMIIGIRVCIYSAQLSLMRFIGE